MERTERLAKQVSQYRLTTHIITKFCLNGSSRSVVRHTGFLFPKFNQSN
nr:MAG TPA: hypothetical protein [Caudoviricetes sp.]DAF72499.1 MAG TPA: hypothetical protein [Caudoviricetes sp.]